MAGAGGSSWVPWYEHASPVLYLEQLLGNVLKEVDMPLEERDAKLKFADRLQSLTQKAILKEYPNTHTNVALRGFGSFASGFALKGSDMDMVLMINGPDKEKLNFKDIANALKQSFKADGLGVYIISNTRVPIIKICEKPPAWFWEEQEKLETQAAVEASAFKAGDGKNVVGDGANNSETSHSMTNAGVSGEHSSESEAEDEEEKEARLRRKRVTEMANKTNAPKNSKVWYRERKLGKSDFPKSDAGILCDINMDNPMGLENTHLLRCYAACDVRVHPMATFVKAWASRRKINSSRDGTLSSYGYVLMVIHFLVHIIQPPVLPNLQHPQDWPGLQDLLHDEQSQFFADAINGHWIHYVRNVDALNYYGSKNISPNTMPVGRLLTEFFSYYGDPISGGHSWQGHVISLRTRHGGVLDKGEMGWNRATSEMVNGIEVRQRYLLAIEDPFETNHNVGRTVTNEGAGVMRREFKRAVSILRGMIGRGTPREDLMEEWVDKVVVDEGGQGEGNVGRGPVATDGPLSITASLARIGM
ncbi:PAP/OAS1 substrate-binding domain-containing protein [Eremomyces bilateralis CBS 781.70]|uniref:polynucleotide adenylyltransferase n=1 Tax=Eremomyces bilateralis CBS 781.70 TaxID=1392243 RepID=A0A6G1G4B5_9PEZI|nr:PAP/OAS1 substrate-binding domain-containing protein [Eremomyces bilateralis CBS 781.70]KAF1812832.1 PAP/OAS1 substrate-binding domain-containing protein [Eremomyces bilateralis CBS 781.70]